MGSLPPWLSPEATDRRARRLRNARSASQEASHAAEVGGRVQSGSGSSWRAPGDVRSAEYMDELKYTSKASYSLTVIVMRKIMRAAAKTGRTPRLIIDFQSEGVRAVVEFEDL
jgi:hypothetical protein